ncbi:acrB/AcrD/AcrF family protein [Rickettsia parkeri str. Tate's Hell]|uniref:AcrB/AcrD/AcrF family protein n=1 Tax=Rickettsia parkeri str. Tate's Hell TaxID=1359189 RepID=A0ABR5DS62_RICPA|nr:acrB/AcrD/AcrF family protein [Rickettsia parkeri str. Tate's Hell]
MIIPTIALPLSVVGTFAFIYLFGYSIDNMSLMALTLAMGFVVDDAIVVLENITRHMEKGESKIAGCINGTKRNRIYYRLKDFIPNDDIHPNIIYERNFREATARTCRCYYYLYFAFGSYLDNRNSYVM